MRVIKVVAVAVLVATSALQAQEISPWFFGQNHWMAKGDEDNRPSYLNQMWPKVEEAGIKMVRVGGNGYEHRFPNRKRLTAIVDSIRGIGAEPLLQVPSTFTEKETEALVKDFKFTGTNGVRFYSIGNEPICNKPELLNDVYTYLSRIAPAIKKADNSVKVFIFDACTFYEEAHEALIGGRLDLTGKDDNGNWIIDGVAFHNYPNGADYDRNDVVFSGPYNIEQQAKSLVTMMDKANKKHGRTGENTLLWGLTETNITYINPDRDIAGIGNPSFLGGQFIAEIYGIGLEYGAFTVNPWCISETDRISTDFGFLGLPTEFYPRSSYYHTQMMALNMKGEFLASSTTNGYVTSIASVSDDEIVVMILNKDHDRDFEFDMFLSGEGDSPKPLSIHVQAGLDVSISETVTNQTTVMFVFDKSGKLKRTYTYGIEQNLKYEAPIVTEM